MMDNNQDLSFSNQQSKDWLEFKRTIILKDYELRSNIRNAKFERINIYRQWEVTLSTAVLAFTFVNQAQQTVEYLIATIIILFMILEILARGSARLTENGMLELEEIFRTSLDIRNVIEKHRFHTTYFLNATFKQRFLATVECFRSVQFWAWHFSIAVMFSIVVLAT